MIEGTVGMVVCLTALGMLVGIPFPYAWFGSILLGVVFAVGSLVLRHTRIPELIAAHNDCVRKKIAADEQIVCQHCQTKGKVVTEMARVKVGISGGKATAAVLTGGWSLLGPDWRRRKRRPGRIATTVIQAGCFSLSHSSQ